MNWDTFFEMGESVTADEARQFIASSDTERYQLVDVRQPREYEQSHIPGAILLPLADLPERQSELDRDKPVIVYCRTGVRSKAACQILIEADVKHVFNMTGGIDNWQGQHSTGDEEAGLRSFVEGDFDTAFALALQMEAGLKRFYQALAERSDNESEAFMLTQMARFEDSHIARLLARHHESIGQADTGDISNLAEGGLDIGDMLAAFGGQLGSPEKVIQLAMKLEAQAFDLYCRLARRQDSAESASFFQAMAHEEQKHLAKLAGELDSLLERT